jgi:hypothetical protein
MKIAHRRGERIRFWRDQSLQRHRRRRHDQGAKERRPQQNAAPRSVANRRQGQQPDRQRPEQAHRRVGVDAEQE